MFHMYRNQNLRGSVDWSRNRGESVPWGLRRLQGGRSFGLSRGARAPDLKALPSLQYSAEKMEAMRRASSMQTRRQQPVAASGTRAGDSSEFRGFIADLFAAAASMQSLRKAIARTRGLGGTELAILLAVWHLGQRAPIGIKALAAHLHVAGSNLTNEVAGLVQKGLLSKVVDSRDTRAIVLQLTPKGSGLLVNLTPELAAINDDLFENMDTAEMKYLQAFFLRLIDSSARSTERLRVHGTVG